MSFEHGLHPGNVIDNTQLTDIFKCSPQGGMRRSLQTNTLVLVSDHVKGIYEDRWVGDTLHYTGMGLEGDQRIDATQNKTLAESSANGVGVFLFEVFETGKYVFKGEIQLAGNPYMEDQPDRNNVTRKVWVFPLKLVDDHDVPILNETVLKSQARKEREAKRLDDGELRRRALYSRKEAGSRQVTTRSYDRNVYVAELAKRRADGVCQLCDRPAPFIDKTGAPFLETHHIQWLSEGGEDSIQNTVALCPNCHRMMHSLNRKADIKKLTVKAMSETV